mmetsp:Transcript_19758/g.62011  ORF Transcript_19758/g.62011 Transcript_19758/m.62011 type:complete len:236 (-) Transcript_19758:367-1074(-)
MYAACMHMHTTTLLLLAVRFVLDPSVATPFPCSCSLSMQPCSLTLYSTSLPLFSNHNAAMRPPSLPPPGASPPERPDLELDTHEVRRPRERLIAVSSRRAGGARLERRVERQSAVGAAEADPVRVSVRKVRVGARPAEGDQPWLRVGRPACREEERLARPEVAGAGPQRLREVGAEESSGFVSDEQDRLSVSVEAAEEGLERAAVDVGGEGQAPRAEAGGGRHRLAQLAEERWRQ